MLVGEIWKGPKSGQKRTFQNVEENGFFANSDENAKMKVHPKGSSENQFSSKTDAFRVSYDHFEFTFSLVFLRK